MRLHTAVLNTDARAVRMLVASGLKPVYLDEERRTPLDVLDAMPIDAASRRTLRSALLGSQNPSAPQRYVKPEAFHGSPWGFEILMSGELRSGANDAKGGTQSLEGKVFFSDRTPGSPLEITIRTDLRKNARLYSNGYGWKSTTATSRGFQYRMAQAMLDGIHRQAPLNMSGEPEMIQVDDWSEIEPGVVDYLAQALHKTGSFEKPEFEHASLHEMFEAIRLPSSLTFTVGHAHTTFVEGPQLWDLYARAAAQLKQNLESGKAPLLAMINEGRVVPIVFGFEKVFELQSHTIRYKPPKGRKDYSYQSENHPLSGSSKGGRLKEIEVRHLHDLATLTVACLARGVVIPDDVTIRIKQYAAQAPQAEYWTAAQRAAFEATLIDALAHWTGHHSGEMRYVLANAPIEQLQAFNAHLRSLPLAHPPRT
ncbi:hypothetical protein Busp01_41780 [Trinickia caryophylli]|nr:hypothetical protein Busp01_41780 [Trinickia caryophylli]